MRELEEFKSGLNATISSKEMETFQITNQLNEMKSRYESEILSKTTELAKVKASLEIDLDSLKRQRDSIKSDLESATEHIRSLKTENSALQSTISTNSALLIDLESQIRSLRNKIEQLERDSTQKDNENVNLEKKLSDAQNFIKELESKVYAGESLRRKLHNQVQELKGNIRVFCRVRPLLENEKNVESAADAQHLIFCGRNADEQEELQVAQSVESVTGGSQQTKTFPFAFDKVFGPNSSQDDVFDEISQLVQSALDGYRVCIFAYGQTGSGKTFTMEGGKTEGQLGMIPRAVAQIFSTADFLKDKGWSFSFEASYLEIYNESIRDLLNSTLDESRKHEIRHANGKTTVSDLSSGTMHIQYISAPIPSCSYG